jgi:reactive intermediate/imine deaminase
MFAATASDLRAVHKSNVKPVGPYSPGVMAGEFLYVSGQGALNAEGKYAPTVEEQTRDTLNNVKSVVEAAGLTMRHVVFTQLYLTDMSAYDRVNKVWAEFFPDQPPARAIIGVYRMPKATPVEVTVVAVRDLTSVKRIGPTATPAILAGGRLFLSGFLGRDLRTGRIPENPAAQVQLALNQMRETLAAAGLDFRHLVFVNSYLTHDVPPSVMDQAYARCMEPGNAPARAVIAVDSLPHGAHVEFAGVAIVNLAERRVLRPRGAAPSATASPCVLAGETLFCSAMSGIYASTVEHQVRQTMRNLLDGLEEAGLSFSRVVSTNVYMDDIGEFDQMNRVYAQYFPDLKPTRTTVQPTPSAARAPDDEQRWPMLEQISLIAVK